MSQLGVLVQVSVVPGKLEELRRHFTTFYQSLGQEEGLELRKLMIDQDDSSRVFVFELWKTPEDFANHLANEHSKIFAENIQGTYEPSGFVRTLTPFV